LGEAQLAPFAARRRHAANGLANARRVCRRVQPVVR
jgi:hypothetical protein